jgi:hypothetical protein
VDRDGHRCRWGRGGAAFGLLAVSKHSTAENDPVQTNAASDQATAKTFSTAADVGFIAGGTIAAAGIVWIILSSRHSASSSTQVGWMTPSASPGPRGAVASIRVPLP